MAGRIRIKEPDLANVQLWKGDNLIGTLLEDIKQELARLG